MKTKRVPKVSVIIPTWNRSDDLRRALKSIFSQSYKNIEVTIVDNGSSDGSVEMVKKEFKKAKLIQNDKNLGVSTAKNQGIAASSGQYLLFCDSDIEMTHKKCIETMVRIMQSNRDIGALGGEAYKLPDGTLETKKKMITLNCETSTVVMPDNDYELEDCGYVATCNCMMPRKLVLDCGGFDSRVIYGGEDKEIGIKLRRRGYRSVVDSRCFVYHYISQSTRHRNLYALNKNRIRIAVKNYSLFHILALPLLDIFITLSPKKFGDLKRGSIDVTKYVKKGKAEKGFFMSKVLKVGSMYFWSLVKAYGWNLWHLAETVSTRIKQPNYLKELEDGNK